MNTDYFKTQLVVTVAGLLAALVLSFIDYESIASFWYLIAGFSVFIMLYTMFFGISVQGQRGRQRARVDQPCGPHVPDERACENLLYANVCKAHLRFARAK